MKNILYDRRLKAQSSTRKESYHLIGKNVLNAACKHPKYRAIILLVKEKRGINDLRLGKLRMIISQNSQEEQHRAYNHSI